MTFLLPAFGTWYSRYAHLYTDVPAQEPEVVADELPALPRLGLAAA